MAAESSSRAEGALLNILDLPADIMILIFEYFQHQFVSKYGNLDYTSVTHSESKERRQAIQNARLVCHVFHQYASPHLCPILRIPLEMCSIETLNAVFKSPFVLEGIRILDIVTWYRPKELAQSLKLFAKFRLKELAEIANYCDYYAETWFLGGYDINDDSICPLPYSAYITAIGEYRAICHAWDMDLYVNGFDGLDVDNLDVDNLQDVDDLDVEKAESESNDTTEYRRLLEQEYAEYRKKHEEQLRMITDGSFVNAVTMFLSRMPHPCSLNFTDKGAGVSEFDSKSEKILLSDMEALTRYMSTPHNWKTIEELGADFDIAPVTLLADLPIAIHRQGIPLQGIFTNCYPTTKGWFDICGLSDDLSWNDLAESCKQLKIYTFGEEMNCQWLRVEHFQGEDKACVDRYFSAMMSSPSLEYVRLKLYSYELNDGSGNRSLIGKHFSIDLGAALRTTHYPFLEAIHIFHISLRRIDFENFANGLGRKTRTFSMADVEMLDGGSWARTLDLLRGKLSSRYQEGRMSLLYLGRLFGGEFGGRELRPESVQSGLDFSFPEEKPLVVQALEYVKGDPEVPENPLKRR